MRKNRRHARPLRTRVLGSARVTVSIALGSVLLLGGGAYAAYRYDAASADRLMPGVTIGGIDVGEMTRSEAVAAVSERSEAELGRLIQIQAGGETWQVTPAELGATSSVEQVIDQALALNEGYSWPERVFRRLVNRSVGHSVDLRYQRDGRAMKGFLESVADTVSVDPSDAAVDYEDGQLIMRRPEVGWQLPIPAARQALRDALRQDSPSVTLPMERIQPEVGKDDLGQTIVVDLSELQLSLYDGVRLAKTYPVAAGSPSYPTPPGEWTIWDKRENPTWINPAPDGWGKGMPAQISGAASPLGTRALYLDAPGIRIHGTSASYSIGSYASHGCVRMFMDDVEELYDIVAIGTTVHIVT